MAIITVNTNRNCKQIIPEIMYLADVRRCSISKLLLRLLLALLIEERLLHSCSASGYSCPARSLIRLCSCNEITRGLEIVCEGVQLKNLREMFENVQQTQQTLIYLKMINNHMHTFPSYLLNNIDVRHLMAHKCNIVHVGSFAFAGLENKLESIDFSDNKFVKIPSESLANLTALLSLNLNYNLIETIHENAFAGMHALLRLTLYGNKITTIHANAFFGTGFNLTLLNLGRNHLTNIPAEPLRILKSIQRLQLHENSIRALSSSDFIDWQSSQNLDVLNLAHNKIVKLDKNLFAQLQTLNSLDLESNQIVKIDSQAFNGIEETLEWLKLGENQLSEIPCSALQNLSKLRELDLRDNQIHTIYSDSFNHFGKSIKFLNLQQNRIVTIENGAFDNLDSLQKLNLQANRLKHLPRPLFAYLLDINANINLQDNPLQCECSITWYQQWLEQNSKQTQTSISQVLKCGWQSNETIEGDMEDIPAQMTISVHKMAEQLACSASVRAAANVNIPMNSMSLSLVTFLLFALSDVLHFC